MNRPRLLSAGIKMIVALGLGAAAMALPGCTPPSEGRPAGSIEVKSGRTSSVEAAKEKAKAQASPNR